MDFCQDLLNTSLKTLLLKMPRIMKSKWRTTATKQSLNLPIPSRLSLFTLRPSAQWKPISQWCLRSLVALFSWSKSCANTSQKLNWKRVKSVNYYNLNSLLKALILTFMKSIKTKKSFVKEQLNSNLLTHLPLNFHLWSFWGA